MKTFKAGNPLRRIFSLLAATASIFSATAQTVQTNLAVTVQHAPSLNGGTIQGSLQQLNAESVNVNSGFTMTGDMLVSGTPTLVLNGKPTYSGTIVGSGSTSPSGYQVTLNSGCSLHYLRTRTSPVSLPTVSVPPSPTGTRSVNINTVGQSYGDATTLRNLTLNSNVGLISVPPGTYGNFIVNGGSGLVLGVAGGLQAVTYNLQSLNLNGSSTLKIVGPVILTVAGGFTGSGTIGASNNPAWLQLQLPSGGLTLNSGCTVYGLVLAPNGAVIVNGNSTLVGTSASAQFTLNSGGLVSWSGSASLTNQPPVATAQSLPLPENSSTNITLTGSDPQGDPLTFTVLTQPAHGTLSGTPPSVTYKPATNYFGSDAFTFKVNNGIMDSSPATVSLAVTQVFYPPTAIAQTLTNFENATLPVTLTGSDPQGYALSFSVLTPPGHGSLSGTAPNLTYQPATNYYGNDSFTFLVNDGFSNSLPATVSITNKPVDSAPLVVAGPNQLIILPTNTVYLLGSVAYDSFPDTVDTVVWSEVNGPTTVTFSNPSNTMSSATFSQSGVYQLRLVASDSFLSSTDDLLVTVDAPPAVNAGQAMTNTFPGTVTLTGSASDDGLPTNGTLTVVWSKISGPGTVVFGNTATTNSTATFGTNGVYVLRLTADDGIATNHSDITVMENLPPLVYGGTNILINGLNVTLNGIVTDDGLPGSFLSTQWSQSSGPGTLTFGNVSLTNTSVTASQSGTYVLVLTASDGAATNSGELVVTFNLPPVVNAGPAQTVNFGTPVLLAGTITDDSLPYNTLTSLWTEVSGPGNATFADASLTNTTATFDQPGIYTLSLNASDMQAASRSDVIIKVNAAPIVNAGANQFVSMGTLVTLAGSYVDDGLPDSNVITLWTQTSGPMEAVILDPSAPVTTVNFSESGIYVFKLTANDGMTNGSAQVTVTVGQALTVTTISSVLINWPTNQALLSGNVMDDGLPDGGALSSVWSQLSGPSLVNFSPTAFTNMLNGTNVIIQPATIATFNAPGSYLLQLTGSDDVSTGASNLRVIVNHAPKVTVSVDKLAVILPDTINLTGTVSDDGLPNGTLTYTWSQVGGPGVADFSNPSSINTTANFSQAGVYTLQLAANDSAASSVGQIAVVVSTSTLSPQAMGQSLVMQENATLPLTLSGTDTNGSPLTFSVVTQPAHGGLSGTPPHLVYLPATNYTGTDSF